jgi:hypothetical protein
MKGQDIGLLFKLVCLRHQKEGGGYSSSTKSWQDWVLEEGDQESALNTHPQPFGTFYGSLNECYSVRSLAQETGISKSQVSLSLNRCLDVGLAKRDRKLGIPRTNVKALFEFVVYGLRYVFPARTGAVTRGITTSLGAPVLQSNLMSAGELVPVWPDALGNTKGQAVEPLFKSVTYAVRRDAELYAFLALIDSIRLGQPRERNIAVDQLHQRLGLER